jgi:hypothetical protein
MGDDAYEQALNDLRADFAHRFDAWLTVAREAFARPTMTGAVGSVAEILAGDRPVLAVDHEAIDVQIRAVYELATMCSRFVLHELGAVRQLAQRRSASRDEIVRITRDRASECVESTRLTRWIVGLRALAAPGRPGHSHVVAGSDPYATPLAPIEPLERFDWVEEIWSSVVVNSVALYLERLPEALASEDEDVDRTVERLAKAVKLDVPTFAAQLAKRYQPAEQRAPSIAAADLPRSVSAAMIEWRKTQHADFCERSGISKADFARQLKVDERTVRAVITESRNVSAKLRGEIIRKLNLTFDDWYAAR